MMDVTVVLCCVAGVIATAVMMAACIFSWSDGAASKRKASWVGSWKIVLIGAVAVCVAAFIVERFAYGAPACTAVRWEVAAALAILAAWTDWNERIIPNRLVIVAVTFGVAIVAIQALLTPDQWMLVAGDALVGCVVGAAIFLVSRLATKGGVGFGDVKLFFALGLLVGFKGLFNVLVLSMGIAFLYSIALLVMKKKKLSDRLPLAPFAAIGICAAIGLGV